MLQNWRHPFSNLRAKITTQRSSSGRGSARLLKELNVLTTRNRVSSLYGTKHLKAAEPGAAQPRARQLSGDARARPTNRHFALGPFFGLSGASPYHVPLNSLNSSIN